MGVTAEMELEALILVGAVFTEKSYPDGNLVREYPREYGEAVDRELRKLLARERRVA